MKHLHQDVRDKVSDLVCQRLRRLHISDCLLTLAIRMFLRRVSAALVAGDRKFTDFQGLPSHPRPRCVQ